jgi:hypothetical protein
MLLGAEFDAEIERERELVAGIPKQDTIALEYRDPPDEADERDPRHPANH